MQYQHHCRMFRGTSSMSRQCANNQTAPHLSVRKHQIFFLSIPECPSLACTHTACMLNDTRKALKLFGLSVHPRRFLYNGRFSVQLSWNSHVLGSTQALESCSCGNHSNLSLRTLSSFAQPLPVVTSLTIFDTVLQVMFTPNCAAADA